MSFPALQAALEGYFGDETIVRSLEDESEAWRDIVYEFRDGAYEGLLEDVERLLKKPDAEIFKFLRSVAPAWTCESPADARRGLEVFQSYVETYSET